MAKKEKSYIIKVPVYTTEMIENAQDMFGGITYENMLSYLRSKINSFKESGGTVDFDNRNKTRKTVINGINFTEHQAGETSGVLMQISAYSTNLYDGYLEAEEKINFKKDYKIGSETNFVMIYPVIKGIDRTNYLRYFIVLVYEDPTKNNEEISKIAKAVLNRILNIPVANIKLPTILDELRSIGTIPELQIKYSAVYNHENDVDLKYREYLVSGKLKKQKEDNFKNMPVDKIEELLNEPEEEDYQKKEAKLTVGKKEYRISKELINEASEALKETAEKVFNASTSITEEELNNQIHNTEFIFSKLTPILENFLSTDNES
ncbi:MAG: hypothetical protein E6Q95_04095 [Chitinophagaceae bacterium]|nr:MAG: hypothetical protein E6Q95_04095 [Chitinophagaceae bacterium]